MILNIYCKISCLAGCSPVPGPGPGQMPGSMWLCRVESICMLAPQERHRTVFSLWMKKVKFSTPIHAILLPGNREVLSQFEMTVGEMSPPTRDLSPLTSAHTVPLLPIAIRWEIAPCNTMRDITLYSTYQDNDNFRPAAHGRSHTPWGEKILWNIFKILMFFSQWFILLRGWWLSWLIVPVIVGFAGQDRIRTVAVIWDWKSSNIRIQNFDYYQVGSSRTRFFGLKIRCQLEN